MRKILITGGPVHAHLDAVKIVTNRFRGGLMAQLAESLAAKGDCEILYLTAPGAVTPKLSDNLMVMVHSGFRDYREKVLGYSQSATDVILGAAVANLIPANPWTGKFPSHNYQEGDIVDIPFVVTPRVITDVKRHAPNVNLFGFKLLSGADHSELMAAAWHTLVSSRATAVIANDAQDLQRKYLLTKEGGEHEMPNSALPDMLWALMHDVHYRSVGEADPSEEESRATLIYLRNLISLERQNSGVFRTMPDGTILGTVAVRHPEGGFWTTGRGKHELEERAYVRRVDHGQRQVFTGSAKATLNAPLLDQVFAQNPDVSAIVHGHKIDPHLPTLPYAQPGTVADSLRVIDRSFNIENHGCFYLYNAAGKLI